MHKTLRALAVEATIFDPRAISIAGDASTPAGERYRDSFANDDRQTEKWHPVKHERMLLSMFSTARPRQTPSGLFNIPQGDRARVFLLNLPEERPGCLSDEAGFFDLLFEDGRQRLRLVHVADLRKAWIRRTFVSTLWAEQKDPIARRVALRNRLLEYGQAVLAAEADASTLPPVAEGAQPPQVGQLVAPWLNEAMVDALVELPTAGTEHGGTSLSSSRWFDDDGDPVPMGLHLEVVEEDPDVFGDDRVLLDSMRRKEAQLETSLAVRAKQVRRMLAAKDAEGKPKHTPHSLALKMGVSKDWINSAIHYTEIAQPVRDAVDDGRVAIKLACTGREAICYGFDKQGRRSLLTEAEQVAIFNKLLEHFRIEAADEGGIADNLMTRQVLRQVKAKILEGTPFAEGLDRSGPRETSTVRASRAAAERAAAEATAPAGDIDADTKKSLAEASADADKAAAGDDPDSEPAPRSKKATPEREPPSDAPPSKDPRKLREQLQARARAVGLDLAAVDLKARPNPEHDAVALAAGLAVLAALEGDSSALLRFPILSGKVSKAKPKGKAPAAASGSPFANGDKARGVLATLVDLWDERRDPEVDMRTLVNEAAEQELGSGAPAEIVAEAAKMLEKILVEHKDAPRKKLGILVREALV